jgi:hypothetical protein
VSNKCTQLTTFYQTTKWSNYPRTAPDLSLRLQRVFWGRLQQEDEDSSDSQMQMFSLLLAHPTMAHKKAC